MRFPFIHYRLEKAEFIRGLIIGATALVSRCFLTEYSGVLYELVYSLVIIEVLFYILHGTLGYPVVPGCITAALTLVFAFVTTDVLIKEAQAVVTTKSSTRIRNVRTSPAVSEIFCWRCSDRFRFVGAVMGGADGVGVPAL